MLVSYECDKYGCGRPYCSKECSHTLNIEHAVNFNKVAEGCYEEITRKKVRIQCIITGFVIGLMVGTVGTSVIFLLR